MVALDFFFSTREKETISKYKYYWANNKMECPCSSCALTRLEFYDPQPAISFQFTSVADTTNIKIYNHTADAAYQLVVDDNVVSSFDNSDWDKDVTYNGKGTIITPGAMSQAPITSSATLGRALFFSHDASSGDSPLIGVLIAPDSGTDWSTISIQDQYLSSSSKYYVWFESSKNWVALEQGQEYSVSNDTATSYTVLIDGDVDYNGIPVFTESNWKDANIASGFNSGSSSTLNEQVDIYDETTYLRCLVWDPKNPTSPVAGILLYIAEGTPTLEGQFGAGTLDIDFSTGSSTFKLEPGSGPGPRPRPSKTRFEFKWIIIIALAFFAILMITTSRGGRRVSRYPIL